MKDNYFKNLFTLLFLLCATAVAAHDFEVNGVYYNILSEEEKTVEVAYKGTSYNEYYNEYTGCVLIPEGVIKDGITYSVISIGNYAFFDCTGLTSIEIPNSVTRIGNQAFYGCTGLTSVTIPNSVTSIGNQAFFDCTGLTSIEIPDSVTNIGGGVFTRTAWYENQPDGAIYLGKVFYKYKGTMPENTSFAIKDGTLSIAGSAFGGCSGLTGITIPNSVTSIGEDAFNSCKDLQSIEIPNSVTSIGGRAFYGCSGLTSVVIGNSVTSIGWGAFYNCSGLTSVNIPNSVTSVGQEAFYNCTGLKKVEINCSNISTWFSGYTSIEEIVIGG